MSDRYWTRLRALLQQTAELAKELCPTPSENVNAEKGVDGALAHAVQGLSPDAAIVVAGRDPVWAEKLKEEESLTNIVVYGLSTSAATVDVLAWAAGKVAPATMHVKVVEADVAALDIGLAERLLKVRVRLRTLRTLSEKCLKIALGLDKKTKVTQAVLDKWKVAFDKAEDMERKKEEKRKAAAEKKAETERARLAREKKREEAAVKRSAKKSSADKKEQAKSARKSFFSNFLKKPSPNVVRSLSSNMDAAAADAGPVKREGDGDGDSEEVTVVQEGCRTVDLSGYKDKSVLPVSGWLTMQIPFDYAASTFEKLRAGQGAPCDAKSVKAHLAHCAVRRQNMENQMGRVLGRYRRERGLASDERSPRFSRRRSDVRGCGKSGPIQLLQFGENHRPAFVGTTSRRSAVVSGRRPLGKDKEINYEFDSDDEWEEEALDGESLSDVENDKENDREDAELRMLYGSDDESDDDDFLDDENAPEEDDGDDEEGELDASEIAAAKAHVAANGTPERPRKDVVMVDKPAAIGKAGVVDVDTWTAPEVIDVETAEVSKKRPLSASKPGSVSKKRRRRKHNVQKAQVQIIGITYGGQPSMLDKFPVRAHIGAPAFELYDPVKEEAREREAAAAKQAKGTKAAAPVSRPSGPKNILDDAGKFDLATLIFGQSTGKDRLVTEFIQFRKGKQQEPPTMSEVQRTIIQLAVREKREKDTRPRYYLRNAGLQDAVKAFLKREGRPKIDFGPLAVPVLAANAVRAPGHPQRVVAPRGGASSSSPIRSPTGELVWQKPDQSLKKALLEHDIRVKSAKTDVVGTIPALPPTASTASVAETSAAAASSATSKDV